MKFVYLIAALALATESTALAFAPPQGRYILFIHCGGAESGCGREMLQPVEVKLAERGYIVRPPDNQQDEFGGAGVDYFDTSDQEIAQDIAGVVNDALYGGKAIAKPRLQNVKNPSGYIGVWLYGKNTTPTPSQ